MHRFSRLRFTLYIVFIVSILSVVTAHASEKQAIPTNSKIQLDNYHVFIQGYNINNSNYFKLRDLAAALMHTPSEFDVRWNSEENAIEIIKAQTYSGEKNKQYRSWEVKTAMPSSVKLIVDGNTYEMNAYTIDQTTYVQLRDLATIADFEVTYDSTADTIFIRSKTPNHAYRVPTIDTENPILTNTVSKIYSRWSQRIKQYVYINDDQTLTTVEAADKLYIRTYDDNFKLLSSSTINFELPMFGAFYSGEKYNYVVFAQNNPNEEDELEVIRIVKYDKQFQRISSAAVTNAYTVTPFMAGSVRLEEHGNTLVLHTTRERYLTEDGLNHQSQLTVIIDTDTMKVINDLGAFQKNHVSHSFDQYVLFDGEEHVLLDHGDAYPRSIVIHKGDGTKYITRNVVDIPGTIGANMTGVSIGGFDKSSSSYLVAYNTINHDAAIEYDDFSITGVNNQEREIKIAAVPRQDIKNGDIELTSIMSYIGKDHQSASIPKLVKINDERFMLLWQEFDSSANYTSSSLKYVYLDHKGKRIGEIHTLKYFKLSFVQPIVYQDKVVWFTNENKHKTFYTIPIEE